MSVFGVDEFGTPNNNLILNAMMPIDTSTISMETRTDYQGFSDVEAGDSETPQTTHAVGSADWWQGGRTEITERPESATDVGTVTTIQQRGLHRDYDYDEETNTETPSTTHWWDELSGNRLSNEEVESRVASLSNRDGARNLREFDEDGDGITDSYSWTQDVQRTFWNFLDRGDRNTQSSRTNDRVLPYQINTREDRNDRQTLTQMPTLPTINNNQEIQKFGDRLRAAWEALFG